MSPSARGQRSSTPSSESESSTETTLNTPEFLLSRRSMPAAPVPVMIGGVEIVSGVEMANGVIVDDPGAATGDGIESIEPKGDSILGEGDDDDTHHDRFPAVSLDSPDPLHSADDLPSISLSDPNHQKRSEDAWTSDQDQHQHHSDLSRSSITSSTPRIHPPIMSSLRSISTRAPPPPPILLRRPTDLDPSHRDSDSKDQQLKLHQQHQILPPTTPTSLIRDRSLTRSATATTASAGTGAGLNISGLCLLPTLQNNVVELEVEDQVPDLQMSPSRNYSPMGNSSSRRQNGMMDTPLSPAWQSLDTPASPFDPSWDRNKDSDQRRNSLEVPSAAMGGSSSFHNPYSNSIPYSYTLIPSPLASTSTSSSSSTSNHSNHSQRMSISSSSMSRFEPTPNHGIHARNLSLFFPQPGSTNAHTNANSNNGARSANLLVPTSPSIPNINNNAAGGVSDIPLPEGRKVFEGSGGQWSFGAPLGGTSSNNPFGVNGDTPDGVRRGKRRGHHHKHSLSHNFFSFLDPTQTNPTLAPPSPIPSSPSPNTNRQGNQTNLAAPNDKLPISTSSRDDDNHHHHHDREHNHAHVHGLDRDHTHAHVRSHEPSSSFPPSVPLPPFPSSPTLSPLPPSRDSLSTQRSRLLKSFAILELVIGSGLWVEGQMSGWRCLAGLGYLVVFDAVGVWVGCVGAREDGWRSFRRPFGMSRLNSLLYFAQSLFLAFAAVYIAKESIEQVLLGPGHEHGGGHAHGGGGHAQYAHPDHGEESELDMERVFPHFLLICATLASLFSGGVLGNHSRLVDAVGTLFLPADYLALPIVGKLAPLLGNPFSVTIAGAGAVILLGSISVPPTSLHSLDSSVSLLLTLLTSALAYPSMVAFGHVLLQTAPEPSQNQMKALKKAIKDVKDDKRVLGTGTVRCWMVSACQGVSRGGGNGTGAWVGTAPSTPKQSLASFRSDYQSKWDDSGLAVGIGNGYPSSSTIQTSGAGPGPRTLSRRSSASGPSSSNPMMNSLGDSAGYSSTFSPSPTVTPTTTAFEFSSAPNNNINGIHPSTYPSAYTPSHSHAQTQAAPTPSLDRRGLIRPPSLISLLSSTPVQGDATLVVTLTVHVHPETSDKEMLEITRNVWKECDMAITGVKTGSSSFSSTLRSGFSTGTLTGQKRRGAPDGEVSVAIKRGWEGLEDS